MSQLVITIGGSGSRVATAAGQNSFHDLWTLESIFGKRQSDSLPSLLQNTQSGEVAHIFLIGSVFGGTGASMFCSIAKYIRNLAKEKGVSEKVVLSGALILPYFQVPELSCGGIAKRMRNRMAQSETQLFHNVRLGPQRKYGVKVDIGGGTADISIALNNRSAFRKSGHFSDDRLICRPFMSAEHFIVGSVFGGTGASMFCSIAKYIRNLAKETAAQDILMLDAKGTQKQKTRKETDI